MLRSSVVPYTAMVSSKATSVGAYLASLPADRRAEIEAVREVVARPVSR